MSERVTFTVDGALAGARQSIPLALSVFACGTLFGILARQTGMSLVEAISMSGMVCGWYILLGGLAGSMVGSMGYAN